MHEMGLALSIIDIVKGSIPADSRGARVERINLKIGKLSAVVADSLRFCFGVAAREAGLDSAELVIEEIPVTARCKDCDETFTIDTPVFICPACSGPHIELLSGRELDIDSIEILENTSDADQTS